MRVQPSRSLLLWCLLLLLPTPTLPVEESFCAAVLYTHFNTPPGQTVVNQVPHPGGPSSLGFSAWYHPDLNSFWAANHARWDYRQVHQAQNDPNDEPKLNIYPVYLTGSSSPLPGWFYLHLSRVTDQSFPILAVWALTDQHEPVGQFVGDSLECGGYKTLPPGSVMPCAGTPIFSPINPNMAVYSWKSTQDSKPGETMITHVQLLWKLDQSACDNVRNEGFRFWVALPPADYWEDKASHPDGVKLDVGKTHGRKETIGGQIHDFPDYGPFVYRTGLIKPKFYGAAGPLVGKIDCDKTAIQGNPLESGRVPDWIESFVHQTANLGALKLAPRTFNEKNSDQMDDMANDFLRWRCKKDASNCRGDWPEENEVMVLRDRQTCKPWGPDRADPNSGRKYKPFWGRCEDEVKNGRAKSPPTRVTPKLDQSPKCPHGTVNVKSSTEHYDYVTKTLPGEMKKEGCDCPKEPKLDELDGQGGASSRTQEEGRNRRKEPESGCKVEMTWEKLDLLGLCKDSEVGLEAYGAREWHARTMLAAILMMIPVSCYVARYQKGQLPPADINGEVTFPLGKWYTLHFYMTLFIGCMFGSALGAIGIQVVVLGYSLSPSAALHRHLGWGIFGSFVLQIFTGSLRPLNLIWRRVVIWTHWGCGLFVYYGGAILCILSYKIPSSPFAFQSHLDPEFHDLTYHAGPLIMVVWLVMDLVYHAYSMAYIIWFDRKHKVIVGIGKYFPILLPVGLRYYRSCTDLQLKKRERNLRWMAYGYTALCVVTFFVLILVMDLTPHLENHGFGPMGCTHDKDGHYNSEDPSITGPDGLCPDI